VLTLFPFLCCNIYISPKSIGLSVYFASVAEYVVKHILVFCDTDVVRNGEDIGLCLYSVGILSVMISYFFYKTHSYTPDCCGEKFINHIALLFTKL
jgi:hypothetical protein